MAVRAGSMCVAICRESQAGLQAPRGQRRVCRRGAKEPEREAATADAGRAHEEGSSAGGGGGSGSSKIELGRGRGVMEWLLHPLFAFDEVAMPVGEVPTPYFLAQGRYCMRSQ